MTFFVFGYWFTNAGDDLFLSILCKRYPKWTFVIVAEKQHADVFKDINNLKIIKRNILTKMFDYLFGKLFHLEFEDLCARLFFKNQIEIGGSIFPETFNWKRKFHQRLGNLKHAKNYYVISSNFGPVKTSAFLSGYQKLLQKSKVVFRDTYSRDLLDISNVKVAPDVVFSLKDYFSLKEERKDIEKEYIAISVINLRDREPYSGLYLQFENKIVNMIKFYLEKGYAIKLMAFCEKEGDLEPIERMYAMFNSNDQKNIKVFIHRNVEETLKIMNDANKIIATRFHASIIGFATGIPVLPIIYGEKTKHVLDDIKQWKESPGISIEEFVSKEVVVLDSMFVNIDTRNMRILRKNADKEFQYLDQINE